MTSVTLRGLMARKARALLTGLAVLLGVAMITGTYIFTDTINSSFEKIFENANQGIDVVVSGRSEFDTDQGPVSQEVPESLVARVRATPGVALASGSVEDFASIFKSNGEQIKTRGAPPLLFSRPPERFNPLEYVEGYPPAGATQVAINEGTADKENLDVGDRVSLVGRTGRRQYTISGLAKFGDVGSIGGATISVVTLPQAQLLAGQPNTVDSIEVAAAPRISPAALAARLDRILPDSVEAKTGEQDAADASDSVKNSLGFLNTLLLVFAGIAIFVGAFIIFNTFSITVAQRTREFALLRTMGASRGQVLRSVMVEALIVGALASLLGLLVGVGAAKGLNEMFKAFGAALPQEGLTFEARTAVVGLLVGTVVTVASSLAPARRATRVPPLAAMREEAAQSQGPSRRRRILSWVLLFAGAAGILFALFGGAPASQALSVLGLGAIALFIAVALLSPRVVPPIAAITGYPLERLRGVAGRIARENSIRNPSRTAVTAAALMIGLALVTFISVLANGMKGSNRDAIEKQVEAQYLVTATDGFTPLPTTIGDAVTQSPVVTTASSVREGLAKMAGSAGDFTGIDPRTISDVYRFEWVDGSDQTIRDLSGDGAIVEKQFAEDKDLHVGDTFSLLTSDGSKAQLTVEGIYKAPPFFPLLGKASIEKSRFDKLFDRPENSYTFLNTTTTSTSVQDSLEAAVSDFPDAKVQSREDWITAQDEEFDNFLILLYVLLALSVIVSVFGMVNTLVLSVFERTRELGMLRAVGMTRHQVSRMVRQESVITALIGAALGLPLGVFLAALVTEALSQFDVQLKPPWHNLIAFAVIAMIVGVIAAVLPARRASRLNVLRALQYE